MDIFLLLSDDLCRIWGLIADQRERWTIMGDWERWEEISQDDRFPNLTAADARVIRKYYLPNGDTPGVIDVSRTAVRAVSGLNAWNDYINVMFGSSVDAAATSCENYLEEKIALLRRLVSNNDFFAIQGGEERFIGHTNPVILGDVSGSFEACIVAQGLEVRVAESAQLRKIRQHLPTSQYLAVLRTSLQSLEDAACL